MRAQKWEVAKKYKVDVREWVMEEGAKKQAREEKRKANLI